MLKLYKHCQKRLQIREKLWLFWCHFGRYGKISKNRRTNPYHFSKLLEQDNFLGGKRSYRWQRNTAVTTKTGIFKIPAIRLAPIEAEERLHHDDDSDEDEEETIPLHINKNTTQQRPTQYYNKQQNRKDSLLSEHFIFKIFWTQQNPHNRT